MIQKTDLVLVCVWPQVRDRELARLLGWYRIPFRKAPKVIAVDGLAFYQPATFGEDGGQIQYFARLLGYELTTRAELLHDEKDHPRAHEEYYKMQIGPLERLPRPIRAEHWRRFAFFYTTGENLLTAQRLEDLVIREEARRKLLWQSLRERAQNAAPEKKLPHPVDLDENLLNLLLGFSTFDEFE